MKMEQPSEIVTVPVPTSVQMPQFLRDRLTDAAAKSARTFTGEVVWRLSASFGMYPDGSAMEA